MSRLPCSFILFHCSLTTVHTNAISWGTAVAFPMQRFHRTAEQNHPIETIPKRGKHSQHKSNALKERKIRTCENRQVFKQQSKKHQKHSQRKRPTEQKRHLGKSTSFDRSDSRHLSSRASQSKHDLHCAAHYDHSGPLARCSRFVENLPFKEQVIALYHSWPCAAPPKCRARRHPDG